jgi:cobalt-zinc-cadmium resistance protein CzcA
MTEEFPGLVLNFSQMIEDRTETALSGVNGENVVKVFGEDLETLEKIAERIRRAIADIRGIKEPGVFHEVGQPNLTVKLDRDRSAHYGLKTDDVGGIVQAALGGRTVTQIFETDRRFDVQAGLSPEYSLNVDSIRRIPVPTLSGGTMTLNDVADIGFTSGASYILRENGRRYIPVKFGVRGRDLDSAASEARTKIGKSIYLPVGYRLEWSGEFAALEQAKDHVAWIGVLSLLLIILLLYVFCNNVRDSVMALFDLPFAASGGILALYFAGLNLSVSAAVGFISVLGLCAVNGVLVLASYKQLQERGLAPEFAMIEACNTRMGLLFMISMSACVASLPATLSHGIGSQLQRPVATVVFGGMLMVSMLGSLFVPVIRVLLMPDRRSAEVG